MDGFHERDDEKTDQKDKDLLFIKHLKKQGFTNTLDPDRTRLIGTERNT